MTIYLWVMVVCFAISAGQNAVWFGSGGAQKPAVFCAGDALIAAGLCLWSVWLLAREYV